MSLKNIGEFHETYDTHILAICAKILGILIQGATLEEIRKKDPEKLARIFRILMTTMEKSALPDDGAELDFLAIAREVSDEEF